MAQQSKIDHSREAVLEAQRIANFFIDEARLSGNKFHNRKEEEKALIGNYDAFIVERDIQQENGENQIMELYLF